ncbi:MAG: tetratricopeptide repeat protein [Pseudomonadota bacterium]
MQYRCGAIVIDDTTHRLTRDGQDVEVQPLVFRALLTLLDRRDRVVKREELFETLWPDTVVSEASLARLIKECRRALDDDAGKPCWIRTVPRVGFQWIMPLDADEGTDAPVAPAHEVTPDFRRKIAIGVLAAVGVAVVVWVLVQRGVSTPQPVADAPTARAPDVSELAAARLSARGVTLLNQRDRASMVAAREAFEQALDIDPRFPEALAGLGLTQILPSPYSSPEQLRRARNLFRRALEADPDEALAHAGLGLLDLERPATWDQAEASLRRAIELDPANGNALNWLATLLGSRGRAEEALLLRRQSLLLDPTHLGLAVNLAINLLTVGRIEEADALTESLAAEPANRRAIRYPRQQVALARGRPDEAIRVTFDVYAENPGNFDILVEAMRLLGDLGIQEELVRRAPQLVPCMPRSLEPFAQLDMALSVDAIPVTEALVESFVNRPDLVSFSPSTAPLALMQIGDAERAQALLLDLYPTPEDIVGERGDLVAPMERALLLAEASRRLEDRVRLDAVLERLTELAAVARANGVRTTQLTSVEARIAALRGRGDEAGVLLREALQGGLWNWRETQRDASWTQVVATPEAEAPLAALRRRSDELAETVRTAAWFEASKPISPACTRND